MSLEEKILLGYNTTLETSQNLNTSKDSKAIPMMASVTDPKIVKSQHNEPVLAKDHSIT
ncbi:24418_t:CDS:1, partial [Dentiscutata erythropus]